MRVFISGISGVAMGPLALGAKSLGMEVFGSDLHEGLVTKELRENGIEVFIGEQDGEYLKKKVEEAGGVDWYVHTSAVRPGNKELATAHELKLKVSKRDEFIEKIVEDYGLKMIGVAGTHGKTTTTAGILWLALKLKLPVSWLVGSTLGFAGAGKFVPGAKYLIYEADEYDRNFLAYHPWLSVIPSVTYDHADIYKTEEEYKQAFAQYIKQSRKTITETTLKSKVKLAGEVRRFDLALAVEAVKEMVKEEGLGVSENELIEMMNEFPGVARRMEKLCDGLYTDYAHHPEEVSATIEIAREEMKLTGKKGLVVAYAPLQNARQYDVINDYYEIFDKGVDKLFWLPTTLLREIPGQRVIPPAEFIGKLKNPEIAEVADFDEKFVLRIKDYLTRGYLVAFLSGGAGDDFMREHFKQD
ncbi:hypothetical protein IKE71_00785 [Candidatus Saccharibacteria bacterium]|nr:hypothetical protein [Candidatus Saccharibacteria bacterium]